MYLGQKITCVIPARLSSSRFPRKPLALIKDRAMVLRVADIARKSKYIDNVIVATEDHEIVDLCKKEVMNPDLQENTTLALIELQRYLKMWRVISFLIYRETNR